MKLIERTTYLDRLRNLIGTPDIKVITGVRRSGKSKLMDAFYADLVLNPDRNVVRIKLNLKEFESLWDKDHLYRYIQEHYQDGKENILIIDEVQLCKSFETIINSLYEEARFEIYLTGSNAFLLSSDLATLFGGRVYELSVYPFSFHEFRTYFPGGDIDDDFEEYLVKGGMAGSYLYHTQEDSYHYVQEIYQTPITKDIVAKYHVENESLLMMIAEFLMDNVGSRTSLRNIARQLTAHAYKTNDKTVGQYLNYLCKSYLFYPLPRYDVKGKRYLESDQKYFLCDLSFRYAVLGTKNADYGHLYENIVALELLRRGYEVYIGNLYDKEIDFVAMKNGMKTYIQVADDISRPETLNRELRPLLSIRDAYPKVLLAHTKHPEYQIEGVRIIDLARWLDDTPSK